MPRWRPPPKLRYPVVQGRDHLRHDLWRLQDAPNLGHDRILDHSGRQPHRGGLFAGLAVPDDVHRHVVAVKLRALLRAGGRHGRAGVAEDQPFQERGCPRSAVVGPLPGAFLKDGVDLIPECLVDDGVMLAGVGLALVDGLTAINAVVQEPVEVAFVDQRSLLVAEAVAAKFARQNRGGAEFDKPLEATSDRCGLGVVHHQLAILHIVSEGHVAPHPDPALARCCHLVADAFADDLHVRTGRN